MSVNRKHILGFIFICINLTLIAQQTSRYTDIRRSYIEGLELFDNQHYVSAREHFKKILAIPMSNQNEDIALVKANATYYDALSAIELQNPDGPKLLKEYIKEHPENGQEGLANFYLGRHYYNKKNFTFAVKHFERAETILLNADQLYDYSFQLGYSYLVKRRYKEALDLLDRAKGTEKYYDAAHYYTGFVSYLAGDYDEAYKNFMVVKDSEQYGGVVPYYMASIYFEQGNYNKVIDYASPLLSNKKQKYSSEINQLMGKAHFELGDYNKALPYLVLYNKNQRRVAKEDMYQLAFTQYKTRDYENAITNFRELGTFKDSIGQNALYLLGDAYLKTNQKGKGRYALMQASNLNMDKVVQENALIAYAKLSYEGGFTKDASEALTSFNELFPRSSKAVEAKELLADLFLSTRDYKSALATLSPIKDESPKLRKAFQMVAFYRGIEHFNNQFYDEARDLFNQSLLYPIDRSIQAQCYFWKGELAAIKERYNEARRLYTQFLDLAPGVSNLEAPALPPTASYGIGYTYFTQKEYYLALPHFEKAANELSGSQYQTIARQLLPELTVRKGDCYFATRQYQTALAAYNTCITRRYGKQDYALFQKALLHGLVNEPMEQIAALKTITTDHTDSKYYDLALFEIAYVHLNEQEDMAAIQAFERIIKERPNSQHIVKAHYGIGQVYYNRSQPQQASSYFEKVIREFSSTPEAQEARTILRNIYTELNQPEKYAQIPGASISEVDSITYRAAQNFYDQKDCANAIPAFTKYLQNHRSGVFSLQATAHRADCYYSQNNYPNALSDYENVIGAQYNTAYAPNAYLKAGYIHYINNNFHKAFEYYDKNLSLAGNSENALKGAMLSAYKTDRHHFVRQYSAKIISLYPTNNELMVEAYYLQGKTALAQNDANAAYDAFKTLLGLTDNEKGVEAKYNVAKIEFDRGNIDACDALCAEIVKLSYNYWKAKAFILWSDVSMHNNHPDEAIAILESLLGSYTGDAKIIAEANEKLAYARAFSDDNSRVKSAGEDFQPEDNQ